MKKTILKSLGVIVFSVLCFGFTSKIDDGQLDKITICHVPPGNPDNCHEITISRNALETHIDHHGDRLICHEQRWYPDYLEISIRTGIPVVPVF